MDSCRGNYQGLIICLGQQSASPQAQLVVHAHVFLCPAAGALSRANSSAKRLSLGGRKPSPQQAALLQDGQLIKAEGRAVGRVKRTIYKTYLSAWGPFFLVPISMVSIALVERTLQVR